MISWSQGLDPPHDQKERQPFASVEDSKNFWTNGRIFLLELPGRPLMARMVTRRHRTMEAAVGSRRGLGMNDDWLVLPRRADTSTTMQRDAVEGVHKYFMRLESSGALHLTRDRAHEIRANTQGILFRCARCYVSRMNVQRVMLSPIFFCI